VKKKDIENMTKYCVVIILDENICVIDIYI